jgi:hypothetical protein
VNAIQYASSQQSRGKNKMKNKPNNNNNNNNNENPKTKTPPPAPENQPQRKLKFTYLICGDDHYTQYCPHRHKFEKRFKWNSQPIVLTWTFPQRKSMVTQTSPPP